MGIRFAKSIKIGNYLRINFNRNGISATIGKRGASVNIGTKGTYLNLSPSAVGVTGTGLSYRQKIAGGILGNKKKKNKAASKASKKKTYISADEVNQKKASSLKKKEEEIKETLPIQSEVEEETFDVVEEYENNQEAIVNLHKYTDPVMSKKQYRKYVDELDSQAMKELCEYAIEGDEDTIENMVSSFMNKLELAYDVRVNYELEDNILYVDLDLPEIEDLDRQYPAYNNGRIVYKRKTNADMKEEYARLVLSLGVFLTANYFNVSSYIDEVVMSAFTTVRDKTGDLVDQYLYSVKYMREAFENCDLSEVDDLYQFLLQFENRINMSSAYTFKAIKPYEMESVIKTNELVDDALKALKELGYKSAELKSIAEKLNEYRYETAGEYLKEGLRLLKEEKK